MNITIFKTWEYNKLAKEYLYPSRKDKKAMNKTNVKYPYCNSKMLYKFELNKQSNKKYQFK